MHPVATKLTFHIASICIDFGFANLAVDSKCCLSIFRPTAVVVRPALAIDVGGRQDALKADKVFDILDLSLQASGDIKATQL